MRKLRFLLLSVLFATVIFSSCKKDDPVNEAKVLVDYVEANFDIKTLPSYIHSWQLEEAILASDPYIIDIREAQDYGVGHIPGAVNVDIKAGESLVEYCQTNSGTIADRDIVVVCYSGQSAAWGVALLKLSGFQNAKSLLFGMSSWTNAAGYDSWTSRVGDNFPITEVASNPKGPEGTLPTLSTGFKTGAEILADRIADVEAAGFGATTTTAQATYDNRDSWYICNYWNTDHYEMMHIPGAIQYDPTATVNPFTQAADLLTVPSDPTQTVVVYCYTGQTSAYVAAYLHVLGYTNAKTLTFGANGMWESTMPGTRWLGYRDDQGPPVKVTDRDLEP